MEYPVIAKVDVILSSDVLKENPIPNVRQMVLANVLTQG